MKLPVGDVVMTEENYSLKFLKVFCSSRNYHSNIPKKGSRKNWFFFLFSTCNSHRYFYFVLFDDVDERNTPYLVTLNLK